MQVQLWRPRCVCMAISIRIQIHKQSKHMGIPLNMVKKVICVPSWLENTDFMVNFHLLFADVSQVKSSHLYLYSAFNNTNCNKALHNIKIGKLCQ